PNWAGGKFNAASLMLDSLTDDEADALIANLVGDDVLAGTRELTADLRKQITQKGGGNPLFVEQMVALLAQKSEITGVQVPPTIQTLLAARLDALNDADRAVIERAAVVGTRFWHGAVVDLLPAELREEVPAALRTLVRRELIRVDPTEIAGGQGF